MVRGSEVAVDAQEQGQSFFYQSLLNFSAQVLLAAGTLLSSVLLARWLGPTGNGAFNLAVLTATLLFQLGNLGLGASTVYFASIGRYALGVIAGSAVAFTGLLGVGLAVLVVSVMRLGVVEGFLRANQLSEWQLALAVMTVPLVTCMSLLGGILLGLRKVVAYNSIPITRVILQIVLTAAFFLAGRLNVDRAILAFFAASFGATLQSVILLYRMTGLRLGVSLAFFRAALAYGIRAYGGTLTQFLSYRANVFFVAHFLGVESVGHYAVALVAAEGLWLIGGSVGQILFPRISSAGHAEAGELSARVTRGVLFTVILLAAGIAPWAGPLVRIVFGAAYLPATPALLWLLPGVVLLSIPKVLSGDLAGRGHPELGAASALASLLVSLPLNVLLIPRLGLTGAALASSLGYAVAAVVILAGFRRMTGIGWVETLVVRPDDIRHYARVASHLFRPSVGP